MRLHSDHFCYLLALGIGTSNAFAPHIPAAAIRSPSTTTYTNVPFRPQLTQVSARDSRLQMIDPSLVTSMDTTSLILSETEAWVQPTAFALDIFTNFFSLAMLVRVVLSWYPTMDVKKLPWSLVVFPTEPLLRAVRGSIPPAFGVDITPIVWLGFFTFVHEILLGQQGLLTMKMKYGI
ncbi:hypothetical protein MPSEU_001030000 [Mayamaea pseudoterrestris]|nr:hypothetical protein MPSEU_001030000 [Mayamaea pseudoterrestris]